MISKSIALQKMIYQLLFYKYQKQNKINNTNFILDISIFFTYLISILFGGMFISVMIFFIIIPTFFDKLFENESLVFQMPLKRTFIISNIYIFSTFSILVWGLAPLIAFSFISVFTTMATFVMGEFSYLANNRDFSKIQENIFAILYAITYINAIIISFFINSSKIKNAFIASYTLVYNSIALYIYTFILKGSFKDFFGTTISETLLLIPNVWIYVIIAFFIALSVTLSGIFISIRLDSPKRTL